MIYGTLIPPLTVKKYGTLNPYQFPTLPIHVPTWSDRSNPQSLGPYGTAVKDTPGTSPLGKCSSSPELTGSINNRSVVGMLM